MDDGKRHGFLILSREDSTMVGASLWLAWRELDKIRLDQIGFGWVELVWVGLDWIRFEWVGLEWIGLSWVDSIGLG